MEIKQIKLSPKKGGNGFISSYSVNIGSKEARDCGLSVAGRELVAIKLIDPENRQIIIRAKGYTITDEIFSTVVAFAEKAKAYSQQLVPNDEDGGMTAADPALVAEANAHDEAYYQYLLTLPLETLTDIMTLLCMGRDKAVNLDLPPLDRYLDYWQYLEQCGCFSLGSEAIASQIMFNISLADYLRSGIQYLLEE